MPLLRLPQKLLRGEKIVPADVFDAPVERIIAEGRLILAALSLFAVYLNPDLLARYDKGSFETVVAYAAFALTLVVMRIWRFPGSSAGYLVHAIDIGFLFVLSAMTEARATPFLAFFAFFVLLAASVRWNWQGVMATAALLALAVWTTGIVLAYSIGSVSNFAFIRGIYVLMTGAMLAYSSAVRER